MRGLGSIGRRKKRHPIRWLLVLITAWAGIGGWCWYKAHDALQAQPPRSAEVKTWGTWGARLLFPVRGRIREMVNLADLVAGRAPEYPETTTLSESAYAPVLDGLLDRGELAAFDRVMAYLSRRHADIPTFRALADFDHGRMEAARSALAGQPAFRAIYETGRAPVVEGVLVYDWQAKQAVPLLPGSAWMADLVQPDRHFLKVWETSLDPEIQRILYESLGRENGAFLLAVEGRLVGMVGKGANPLTDTFEAGSVIKVVTMAAALTEGSSIAFPYHCNGPIRVEGQLFYDWTAHGVLKDYAHSLACSCNLVFAETALGLGPEVMDRWLETFGVTGTAGLTLGEWPVQPATLAPADGAYALARSAIGLDAPAITPYWLIMTADLLAHGGVRRYPTPFTSETIVGHRKRPVAPEVGGSLIRPEVRAAILDGMHRAVSWDKGTARRAAVPGVDLWVKTGTAGASPFNSILMGGFELAGREYTFGLYVEKGGKAELGGARVLREALNRLTVLMKKRQRPGGGDPR